MQVKYTNAESMIVPRTWWNTKTIYSLELGLFKAINQREYMLWRLGIHPIEIIFMDEDTIYFLISEFYCMDARHQFDVIAAEELARYDLMQMIVENYAKDPYKKQEA